MISSYDIEYNYGTCQWEEKTHKNRGRVMSEDISCQSTQHKSDISDSMAVNKSANLGVDKICDIMNNSNISEFSKYFYSYQN